MENERTLQIDTFLPYMRDVFRCEQSLHELNLMWRMIESSAKMNCPVEAKSILPTMAATRDGFNRLEKELVTSLVNEKVANVLEAIGTKAQYVIDIVVRNLYERTADVGFLATDRELCTFVAGLHNHQDAIRYRLRAYRSKYSVYEEIMLLDTFGNVLVQIDENTPVEGSIDPLIAQTLACDTFVETFRATDLQPGKSQALIYSRRMLHPDTGAVVGVLCLCFGFEEELAGIFRTHRDPGERSNMLLLDGENRVISSADASWIPPGAIVPVNTGANPRLMVYGGREYLVRTFVSDGYQGYGGPRGWKGQVMIPVELAFSGEVRHTLATLDPTVAAGVLSHASTFSPPLFEIMTATETIRRVVWNGQVISAGQRGELQRLKTILEQISETGTRSNELFSRSIRDLYETVLESSLRNSEFVSHLMVDLLDRNLYERANDCRWWAVTPELRVALAEKGTLGNMVRRITDILTYINKLYTVYARIFVYDTQGIILASTHATPGPSPTDSVIGLRLNANTLEHVLALRSEQDYHVTPFEATPLNGNVPTYIYHAAIRDPDDETRVVGGIGIVFDAAGEFSDMLQSGLTNKADVTAFYIDRNALIISSTDPTRSVGSTLDVAANVRQLKNGETASSILVHDGQYAVMGCTASHGYREFKVSDDYRDDVLAVVFTRVGQVRSRDTYAHTTTAAPIENTTTTGNRREYATFYADGALFAIAAENVVEALPAAQLSRMSGGHRGCIGMLVPRTQGKVNHFVWVYDLGMVLIGKPSQVESGSQIIVLEYRNHTIGILVDALHAVPQFSQSEIMMSPFVKDLEGAMVSRLIKANSGRLLIQEINIQNLFSAVTAPAETAELKIAA